MQNGLAGSLQMRPGQQTADWVPHGWHLILISYGVPSGNVAFDRKPLTIQPPLLLHTWPDGQLLIPPKLQIPPMQIFAGQLFGPQLTPSLLFFGTQSPLQS
jgi:hypothetical protein